MFNHDSILNLDEEYSFEVTVEDNDQSFAGKLMLSPKQCFLHVMTERKPSEEFYNSTEIYCSTISNNFNLYELKFKSSSSNFVLTCSDQTRASFYELTFEVGFILISKGWMNYQKNILSFTIDAPLLAKWIDYTQTQDSLMRKVISNEEISKEDKVEFRQYITDYGELVLYYNLIQNYSIETFSFGSNYPPKLTLYFNTPKSISELHKELNKFYDLMTFIIGSDFDITNVAIDTLESNFSSSSVYFPTDYKINETTYPILPLGHNSVRYASHLKELPLEAFNNYYKLPEHKRIIFTKYLRYKRMKSDEEKFLGFFRLLEKLTYKSQSYVDEEILKSILSKSKTYLKKRLNSKPSTIKDLSKRIEKTNQMKYNTLKCLSDFYDSIPIEIQNSLLFKKDELGKITKLRNDITHANEYSIESRDLYQYTSFINALLFLALIAELEIPLDVCIPIARNLNRI